MKNLTAFEQGYEAYLKGRDKEQNPFDKETCPHSHMRWGHGWKTAQHNRMTGQR